MFFKAIGSFQHVVARPYFVFLAILLPRYGENKSQANSAIPANIYYHPDKSTKCFESSRKSQISILSDVLMASCIRTNVLFAGVN